MESVTCLSSCSVVLRYLVSGAGAIHGEFPLRPDIPVLGGWISSVFSTQFNNYVRKYDGKRYVKHFTCWNQLLAMMFGQLSNRESLRDLIVAFEAHRAKQYHLGLGRKPIAKTTFASANQNRD